MEPIQVELLEAEIPDKKYIEVNLTSVPSVTKLRYDKGHLIIVVCVEFLHHSPLFNETQFYKDSFLKGDLDISRKLP